jgi:uncharacterized membrane protein YcaP (DUF421 family)
MTNWQEIDYSEIFAPTMPVPEILLRATLTYLLVCVLVRLIPKRQAGQMSPQDVIGAVIVGGLAVSGIAKDLSSMPDVLLMIGTILCWNFILDWVGDRFPGLRHLLHKPPTPLIRDGVLLRRNMREELVTEEELMAQLRKLGVHDIRAIREACVESDGTISVVNNERLRDTLDEPPPESRPTTDSPLSQLGVDSVADELPGPPR